MSRCLVETTGDFQLVDGTNQHVPFNRPAVVTMSQLFQVHLGAGRLRVLINELTDEATDAEFLKYWIDSDKNKSLAVASFASSFQKVELVPELEPAPEKGGKGSKPSKGD